MDVVPVFCVSYTHRQHFLNSTTEIIRTCCVLLFKSPAIDQIPAELIKAGGRTIRYEVHKLIISLCNKEDLPEEWKESIIVPI